MTRANSHRGEVELKLAGEVYRLVPSFENLAAIETIAGDGLLAVARRLGTGEVHLKDIVAIIAATAEPELSEEEAGRALTETGLMNVIEPLGHFMVAALTGGEEGNAKAQKGKGKT